MAVHQSQKLRAGQLVKWRGLGHEGRIGYVLREGKTIIFGINFPGVDGSFGRPIPGAGRRYVELLSRFIRPVTKKRKPVKA